uniref:F-box domain-containing protein n=1 Tax=Mycena chlorophos TaxID=658473 RepID=A0ABQ0KUN3_MYCCL|nr:predicted protein [Mycena chlorophos]
MGSAASKLNVDILTLILEWAEPLAILRVTRVCRALRTVASQRYIWRTKGREYWPDVIESGMRTRDVLQLFHDARFRYGIAPPPRDPTLGQLYSIGQGATFPTQAHVLLGADHPEIWSLSTKSMVVAMAQYPKHAFAIDQSFGRSVFRFALLPVQAGAPVICEFDPRAGKTKEIASKLDRPHYSAWIPNQIRLCDDWYWTSVRGRGYPSFGLGNWAKNCFVEINCAGNLPADLGPDRTQYSNRKSRSSAITCLLRGRRRTVTN